MSNASAAHHLRCCQPGRDRGCGADRQRLLAATVTCPHAPGWAASLNLNFRSTIFLRRQGLFRPHQPKGHTETVWGDDDERHAYRQDTEPPAKYSTLLAFARD